MFNFSCYTKEALKTFSMIQVLRNVRNKNEWTTAISRSLLNDGYILGSAASSKSQICCLFSVALFPD
jgi:hypothetical protein